MRVGELWPRALYRRCRWWPLLVRVSEVTQPILRTAASCRKIRRSRHVPHGVRGVRVAVPVVHLSCVQADQRRPGAVLQCRARVHDRHATHVHRPCTSGDASLHALTGATRSCPRSLTRSSLRSLTRSYPRSLPPLMSALMPARVGVSDRNACACVCSATSASSALGTSSSS